MSSRPSLADRLLRHLFERNAKTTATGIRVAVPFTDSQEQGFHLERIDAALALLRAHDPARFGRVRRNIQGILVYGTVAGLAEWRGSVRLVVLRATYLSAPSTTIGHLAATLVHEGTHAWLDGLGFDYRPERRERIEAICFRSEIAFAQRLPDGSDIVARAERQLARDSEYWTPAAFQERGLRDLAQLGVPAWIVSIVRRVGRLRAG